MCVSQLAELRHHVDGLQTEAACGVRAEQVAELDGRVAAVRALPGLGLGLGFVVEREGVEL